MPTRQAAPAHITPCGDPNRSPVDVVGRLNDLINCYILSAEQFVKQFLTYGIIGVILVAIMILAANTFLKE